MADDTFDAWWLTLREPVDHRSRSDQLVRALAEECDRHGWNRFLDLGTGTGSNVRYLRARLHEARRWTLVDHDAALLESAVLTSAVLEAMMPDLETLELTACHGDLAREGLDLIADHDVVTASALLDLLSLEWVEELAARCARRRCGVLIALSYDGRIDWDTPDPDDELVREAVNAHQRRDKGTGPALGPDAATVTRHRLEAAGYSLRMVSTPWVLEGEDDAALARALLDGWMVAAIDVRSDDADRIRSWADRRRARIDEGAYRLEVGHQDLLALPPGERGADDEGDPNDAGGASGGRA